MPTTKAIPSGLIIKTLYPSGEPQLPLHFTQVAPVPMTEVQPEKKLWDPAPGALADLVPETPNEDEDADGRSETEQLFDSGNQKAERDRMLQAARIAAESPEL